LKISVNGEATETGFATLGELAATEFGISTPKGIALAVNESVVPNSEWNSFSIKEGDKILVVQATQGG
jgi:sulfur carrier protein